VALLTTADTIAGAHFVGTILGGIWADQSWGRFWGWDPKENGALLIVLWNATILHARWGGLIRERGLAVMSVFGNIVVSLSWFGVNMLGVGLHSYGVYGSGVRYANGFYRRPAGRYGTGVGSATLLARDPGSSGKGSGEACDSIGFIDGNLKGLR
jgi:hypothetical protein